MSTANILTAEQQTGHALALIHRILPRLDEPARSSEVQSAFQAAITALKNACAAHGGAEPAGLPAVSAAGQAVAPEIAAIIAAAISVVLDRPHRVMAVEKVNLPEVISHLNVWAFEGRTQIFTSHKVR